jgi:hypothetical protein
MLGLDNLGIFGCSDRAGQSRILGKLLWGQTPGHCICTYEASAGASQLEEPNTSVEDLPVKSLSLAAKYLTFIKLWFVKRIVGCF